MSKLMRKPGRPIALALVLGIIGVLAVFAAVAVQPGVTQAQADPACATPFGALLPQCGGSAPTTPTTPTTPTSPTTPTMPVVAAGDNITSDSTSGGASPEFKVVIDSLPANGFGGGQLHRAVPGGRLPGARKRYRPARCTSLRRRRARRREMAPGCTPSLRRT